MLKKQRFDVILKEINTKGAATLKELSILIKASESSIRSDIVELDKKGLLRRVHGGAYSINKSIDYSDIKYELRSQLEIDAKIKIAEKANEFILENFLIFIDSGTTTFELVKKINANNVTIVTNSITVANELKNNSKITTFLVGGQIKKNTSNVIGSLAIENISNFNFDIGFFGANGYSNDLGFSTPEINESMLKKAAVLKCKIAYFLVDKTKINETSRYVFATKKNNVVLITNYQKDDIEIKKVIKV